MWTAAVDHVWWVLVLSFVWTSLAVCTVEGHQCRATSHTVRRTRLQAVLRKLLDQGKLCHPFLPVEAPMNRPVPSYAPTLVACQVRQGGRTTPAPERRHQLVCVCNAAQFVALRSASNL